MLVVEDEPRLSRELAGALGAAGYVVDCATDGARADLLAHTERYDAVLLDLGLPQQDGLALLRAWREQGLTMPVLVVTARGGWHEKVEGIDSGADDYVGKPFSPKELVARVRAVLRRAHPSQATPVLTVGPITLDAARHAVSVNGQAIVLTPKEFDLLQALLEAAGRVLSREFLLNRVWGYARADVIESRTVDVHVRRLRAKLGDAGGRIATVKSIGYRFETDPP